MSAEKNYTPPKKFCFENFHIFDEFFFIKVEANKYILNDKERKTKSTQNNRKKNIFDM